MTLKVTTEARENRQLAVTIEVPQERVDKELRKAAEKVGSKYRIPGFRKGKAPYSYVVQQFGLGNLYQEFVDDLGNEVYREALEQERIEPYAIASMEDFTIDPLTYRLIVPLEPTVELSDYRALRVEPEKNEVSDEQVDERLEQLREQYASWQEVQRPSQLGDMLNIDVKAVIPASGDDAEIVVLDETDWDVTPDEEHPMDPPGFDDALLGITPGESKQFELAWPEESQSIYAGKTGTFNVTLNSIQAYEKPALDDDFTALVGPDYENLDALRASIRETLEKTNEAASDDAYLEKVLDEIVAGSTLDYPPAVVEDQLDSMMGEFERRLRMFGIDSLDSYFKQVGQDADEYRESLREQAVVTAKRNLVLSEIVRAEQLDANPEEINAHIHALVGNAVQSEGRDQAEAMHRMLHSNTGASLIANDIIRAKAIRLVLASARGEEVAAAGEHPVLMPEGWDEHQAHHHDHDDDREQDDEHDHDLDDDDHDHEHDDVDDGDHDDDDDDEDEEESSDEESSDESEVVLEEGVVADAEPAPEEND